MDLLLALWLPVILTTLALFFASFLAWTVLPHHKPEWSGLPDEDDFRKHLEEKDLAPGQYIFPYCEDPKEMKDPEKKAKFASGCQGTVTIFPGPVNMVRNLGLTVLYFLLTSVLIAYLAAVALDPGAAFGQVFQVVATAGILTYAAGGVCNGIWFGKPTRAFITDALDGIAYGLIAGAIFAVLWPAAAAVPDVANTPLN